MKKSNLKKYAALLIVGVMQLSVFTGCCGSSNDSNKSESTTATDEEITTVVDSTSGDSTETDSSADTSADETAIEQVFNHIEVDGRHVDFPFTLNDLGDDYDFENCVDMCDGTYGETLLYNGKIVGKAYIKANNEKDINRDSDITQICLEYSSETIIVNDVGYGSSAKETQEKFSLMKKFINNDGTLKCLEYSDVNYYAAITISDDYTVDAIILEKKLNY